MKILVADDSRVMRQIILRTLRQAGFTGHDIVEAEDGQKALALIGVENPDVVLSDWNMPEMTGIQLLRQLRSAGQSVPFVFITSETTQEMRDAAEVAGAQFFITKPFTADVFRDALEPILK